jgi:hypothetical protein
MLLSCFYDSRCCAWLAGVSAQKKRTYADIILALCKVFKKLVPVKNLNRHFQDGLALGALIQYHNASLIDITTLNKTESYQNLTLACNLLEKVYGVTQLLDPGDLVVGLPDDISVATYVTPSFVRRAISDTSVHVCRYLACCWNALIKRHRELWPVGQPLTKSKKGWFGGSSKDDGGSKSSAVVDKLLSPRGTRDRASTVLNLKGSSAPGGDVVSMLSPRRIFFGVALERIYEAGNVALIAHGLPLPVYHCTRALEDEPVDGMFTMSGSFAEIDRLKQAFERGT